MDHAVHAVFDPHKNAVVGNGADLSGDLVARLVLVGEQLPGIGLELLQAEADTLGFGVYFENLRLHRLAHFQQFRGVLDLLGPAHLADVDQALDSRFDLDEGTVVGN